MIAYFDNSATTKPCAEAVAAMTDALQEGWGNPSSLHKRGSAAARQLRQARLAAAALLGCEAERVFFTSGGTEADYEDWQQPIAGITNKYQQGAIVRHNGKLWQSAYPGQNVWEPGVLGTETLWVEYASDE